MKYRFFAILLGILFLGLLSGCGGGGGGGESGAPAPTPTANISLDQSNLDFAGIVLNNSVEQTIKITNTGNANLSIGQISTPNSPFSITADCSNAALTPSRTCSLRVRFAPTTQGPFTGSISIPSNDPDTRVVNISLKGTGYGLNVWINKVDSTGCPSINVDVTVTDPANPGSLLNLLTKDNFRLYQNGQLQSITASAIQYPSPVSLVLALDFSVSEQGVINTIQTAANSFINLLNVGDYAAICKFNGTIGFSPDNPFTAITGDGSAGKNALITYINASFPVPNGTLLFTALLQSIDRAAQGTTDKRAAVVLSDGIADMDTTGLDQVIAEAVNNGIPVFTIYYVDPNYTDYTSDQVQNGMLNMQRLASETHGQYYNGLTSNLADVFGQISNVLSNKYTLNYSSSTCSGTISVQANTQADWNGLYGEDSRSF